MNLTFKKLNGKSKFNRNKYLLCLLLLVSLRPNINAQHVFKGKVVDSLSQKPVSNAIINQIDIDSTSILSFNISNDEGQFEFFITEITKPLIFNINRLGYKPKLIIFNNINDLPNSAILEMTEDNIVISEYVVSDRAKITEKSDTTTFDVKRYRDSTEKNLEQLLIKIPGVEIEQRDGTILFKGKQIKRILIEGDDISGSDYRIVSRSVNPLLLETIQVIDKFESNDLLKNFSNSDEQVLNLTLKKEYAISNSGQVGIGYGFPNYHNHDAKLLSFNPTFKLLSTVQYNTIGTNSSRFLQNAVSSMPRTPSFYFSPIYAKNNIRGFVEVPNLNRIPINSELYNFNNSGFGTVNFTVKIIPQLKLTGFVSHARETNDITQNAEYLYKTSNNLLSITSSENTQSKPNLFTTGLTAENTWKKNQLSYQVFFSNNWRSDSSFSQFNNTKLGVGSKHNSYKLNTELNFVSKLSKKAIFISSISLSKQKNNELLLTNESGNLRNWYFNLSPISSLSQNALLETNDRQVSAGLFLGKDSSKLSFSLGILNSEQLSNTQLSLKDSNNNFLKIQDSIKGTLNIYDYFSQVKWQKKWRTANMFVALRVGIFQAINSGNKMPLEYLLPEIGFNQKNNNSQFFIAYNSEILVPNFNDLYAQSYFVSNFRSIQIGINDLSPTRINKITVNYLNSNLKKGQNIYLNINVSNINGGYAQALDINNDFIFSSKIVNDNRNMRLFMNVGADKFIEALALRFFLKPYASYSTTQNNLEGIGERQIKLTNFGNDFQIRSGFINYFNFAIRYNHTRMISSFESNQRNSNFNLRTNNVLLNLFFNTSKYSRFEIDNEGVFIGTNENSDNSKFWYTSINYFFSPVNKNWDISVKLYNLFNTTNWTSAQINDIESVITSTKLIPRYFLVKFNYSFNSKSN